MLPTHDLPRPPSFSANLTAPVLPLWGSTDKSCLGASQPQQLSSSLSESSRTLPFTFLTLMQKRLAEEPHSSPELPLVIEALLCKLTHFSIKLPQCGTESKDNVCGHLLPSTGYWFKKFFKKDISGYLVVCLPCPKGQALLCLSFFQSISFLFFSFCWQNNIGHGGCGKKSRQPTHYLKKKKSALDPPRYKSV